MERCREDWLGCLIDAAAAQSGALWMHRCHQHAGYLWFCCLCTDPTRYIPQPCTPWAGSTTGHDTKCVGYTVHHVIHVLTAESTTAPDSRDHYDLTPGMSSRRHGCDRHRLPFTKSYWDRYSETLTRGQAWHPESIGNSQSHTNTNIHTAR